MKKAKKDRDISTVGSLLLFFKNIIAKMRSIHPFKRAVTRQKELAFYSDKNCTAESKLAYGFGMARMCCIIALCILLSIILIFGGSIFSYEKVYYMFKDIEYINSFNEGRPQTLSYSKPLTNQNISVFKDGLAVASDSEIKLFTSTGRATLSIGSEYSNPKITTSDSYALIYDQGNRSFSVYNSFVCLYSERLNFPISSAHMSSRGDFCIVTKSKDYGSLVKVYGSDFRGEYEYSRNDYIVSAKLSNDGKYLAVASLDTENGVGKTSITLIRSGKDKVVFEISLTNSVPYDIAFLSNERIAVICESFAYVYDLNGKLQTEYKYPHKLSDIAFGNDGFALVFDASASGEGYIVSAFDKNGRAVRSFAVDNGVFDVKIHAENIFLLCDREIRRYNSARLTDEYESVSFSEEDAILTVFSSGEIMACTPSVAYYISFN